VVGGRHDSLVAVVVQSERVAEFMHRHVSGGADVRVQPDAVADVDQAVHDLALERQARLLGDSVVLLQRVDWVAVDVVGIDHLEDRAPHGGVQVAAASSTSQYGSIVLSTTSRMWSSSGSISSAGSSGWAVMVACLVVAGG